MKKFFVLVFILSLTSSVCNCQIKIKDEWKLQVSSNGKFLQHKDGKRAYGLTDFGCVAINAFSAQQLIHLKNLILSRPCFERIHDQSISADSVSTKYNYLESTHRNNYLFVYSNNCRKYKIHLGKISGDSLKAFCYNPINEESAFIKKCPNKGTAAIAPPCSPKEDDWV